MTERPRLGSLLRSYDELHALLRARAEEVEISRMSIDELGAFPNGYAGKLLSPTKVKMLHEQGSLWKMLRCLGLAVVVVEDPHAAREVQAEWGSRTNAQVRSGPSHWRSRPIMQEAS